MLGPLEVRRDGKVLAIGGAKPRAILAALLPHADRTITVGQLAGSAWTQSPRAVASNLRTYVAFAPDPEPTGGSHLIRHDLNTPG